MLNHKNTKPLHDSCPHVFIVGAHKGGTTSLYQYLSKHPDFGGILLDKGPSAGETFYFQSRYEKCPWEYYASQFPVNKCLEILVWVIWLTVRYQKDCTHLVVEKLK